MSTSHALNKIGLDAFRQLQLPFHDSRFVVTPKPSTTGNIMIIWSGLGFLVAVIVFGFSLVFNLAFDAWWGAGYYDAHKWPFGVSLLLSAMACWFLGAYLRHRGAQTVIDTTTGQEMVLDRGHHQFFFIPMHLWGPILAVGGGVVCIMDFVT